jgi:hypothetical protein
VSLDDQIGPEEGAYSEDGVDLTLIRWMLSLTPAQRLEVLQGFVDSVMEVSRPCSRACPSILSIWTSWTPGSRIISGGCSRRWRRRGDLPDAAGAGVEAGCVAPIFAGSPASDDAVRCSGRSGRHRAVPRLRRSAASRTKSRWARIACVGLDLETLIAVKEEVGGEKDFCGASDHAAYARRS